MKFSKSVISSAIVLGYLSAFSFSAQAEVVEIGVDATSPIVAQDNASEVLAGVKKDLDAGLTPEQIIANALLSGSSIEAIMKGVAKADKALVSKFVAVAIGSGLDVGTVIAAAFKVAPKQAKAIVSIAIANVSDADAAQVIAVAFKAEPKQAKNISDAAKKAGVDPLVILAQSLGVPGLDPSDVSSPPAAGNTTADTTADTTGNTTAGTTANTTSTPISAPTFSSSVGTGGGGASSPGA